MTFQICLVTPVNGTENTVFQIIVTRSPYLGRQTEFLNGINSVYFMNHYLYCVVNTRGMTKVKVGYHFGIRSSNTMNIAQHSGTVNLHSSSSYLVEVLH